MTDNDHKKEYQKEYMKTFRHTHKRVELNLTLKEYQAFEKSAKAEGLSVQNTIKNMATAYHQQSYFVPHELSEKLETLHYLIRNVANNINQMAHRSNTLKIMVEDHALLMELKKLEDMVTEFTLHGLKK